MTTAQKLAIALAVSAVMMLITILSKSWFVVENQGGLGPSGVEACRYTTCEGVPWSTIERFVGADVPVWATIGMIAGLAAAAGVAAAAVLAWVNGLARVPVQLTRAALGITAFGCTFMEVRVLTAEKVNDGSIGWAAVLGIASIVTAGILMQKLAPMVAQAKAAAPPGTPRLTSGPPGHHAAGPGYAPPHGRAHARHGHAPQQPSARALGVAPTMASNPGGPPAYPCPRCQKSLVFVAQYQRWFCEACRQYA